VDSAVAAAAVAQRELVMLPLDTRRRMIDGNAAGGAGASNDCPLR
jgi:hypothetical protein